MNRLEPFGPAAGTDIGDLYVETDPDTLTLSGTLTIPRDSEGLRRIAALQAILTAAEEAILRARAPEAPPAPMRPVRGPNPFG